MIVVALAVGYVVLGRYVSEYRARPVAAGDRLAKVPGLDWNQHEHTLVLALSFVFILIQPSKSRHWNGWFLS